MTDDSFEVFVRRESDALFRTARVLTGNATDAEDLLQTTLTYLFPRWDRVQQADVPVAYVRRALTNRFISDRRSAASRVSSHWQLPELWDLRGLDEDVAIRTTIWQMLGTLPPRQRAAIVLRHLHDLPDSETAAALGCREATVRSLIRRGLAAMRAAHSAAADSEVVEGGSK